LGHQKKSFGGDNMKTPLVRGKRQKGKKEKLSHETGVKIHPSPQ